MIDRARLVALLADTLVPPVEGGGTPETAAFLRRSATDLGVVPHVLGAIGPAHEDVLRRLNAVGFEDLDLDARTALLRKLASEPETSQPFRELKGVVMGLFYGLPDDDGANPNWPALGYPGPRTAPPSPDQAPKTIAVERPVGPEAVLEADVCVVGSGAGGAVIAAELQAAGFRVLVLERGGYRNESDFRQLELVGARELYLRGGLFWSESGSIGLLAGATLGGGTVVNSLVCLRPPAEIRAQWAAQGLAGVDGDVFDAHLNAVCGADRRDHRRDAAEPDEPADGGGARGPRA